MHWQNGPGPHCIIREKLNLNDYRYKQYCVINGIAIAVHEFGYLLGWGHSTLGNYDIMDGCGKTNQNCPSHVNMLFKLKPAGLTRQG